MNNYPNSGEPTQAKLATQITLKAQAGKEAELAQLLYDGAKVVAQTEPGTLDWYALRIDHQTFQIFDTFANETGRRDHFEGQVASLLKAKAEELVDGGWEQGVLANVQHAEMLSSKR